LFQPYDPPLITSTLVLVLILLFLPTSIRAPIYRSLLVLCLATVWWHVAGVALFLCQDAATALQVARLGHIGILYLPVAYHDVFAVITGRPRRRALHHGIYAVLLALLGAGAIVGGIRRHSWGYFPEAGILHPLFVAYLTYSALHGMLTAVAGYRTARDRGTRRRLLVCVVAGFICTFGSSDLLINYGWTELYPLGFVSSIAFVLVLAHGIVAFDLIKRDEHLRHVESTSTALQHEVSQREQDLVALRAEIIQKEKLASLGLIATGVAHQLGNALNVISTSLVAHGRLLALDPLDRTVMRRGLDRMTEALGLARSIISSINAVSKENDEKQSSRLSEIIDAGIVLVKGKALEKVDIRNHVPDTCVVHGSKSGLIQVFMNLFENSVEAIEHDRGVVAVEVTHEDDASYLVSVSDNGSGMPPAMRAVAFEPFTTSKAASRGTGLGLYLVKKEIEASAGEVSFESTAAGTAFYLKLAKG
jgi:signal transduction histidine kinase